MKGSCDSNQLHIGRMFILGILLCGLLLCLACGNKQPGTAEQKTAKTPPTPVVAPTPPQPPPPPPPPETSQGTLVSVERTNKVMAKIVYLTISGLSSDIEEQKAEKGKSFIVLHFEKRASGQPKENSGVIELNASGSSGRLESKGGKQKHEMWLTDSEDKKYMDAVGMKKKDKSHLAYEIPKAASGLVWHDGDQAYQLEPMIIAIKDKK